MVVSSSMSVVSVGCRNLTDGGGGDVRRCKVYTVSDSVSMECVSSMFFGLITEYSNVTCPPNFLDGFTLEDVGHVVNYTQTGLS